MVDYVDAFEKGVKAANAADRARKEIDAVFAELNKQLSEATNGKIRIDRNKYTKPPNPLLQMLSKAKGISSKHDIHWAIVAFNPTVSENIVHEIARWSADLYGYPCKITWRNMVISCEDREALENSLAELLQDPVVGETLNSLMQLETTQLEEKTA